MRVMKRVGLCALMAAASLLDAGAARAGAEVTHASANGATAFHNSNNGTTAFDLAVSRNDVGTARTTFLSFETQTCAPDFSVCSGIVGFGNIPNGDFSVGTGSASLNTNTLTNSGFTVFNYTNDFVNNIFTQTPATGGIVIVNWKKIPRESSSFNGTSTFVFGPFSNKITGQQDSDQATSTGSLLGMPLPSTPTNGSGLIGTNKSSQIVIFRN